MKCVVSILSEGTCYAEWVRGEMRRSVLIRGHGKPVLHAELMLRGSGSVAQASATTEVSNADAEFLATHKLFMAHRDGGFVKIVNGDRTTSPSGRP